MAGHPTVPPRRTVMHGRVMMDDTIKEPQLGTNCVGLTQAATCLERRVTMVPLGITPAAGEDITIFRAPASGATIQGIYVCPGSAQNHSTTEADTWSFLVSNMTTGKSLNAVGASLSGQTLAATAFKSIPINNGYATVLSGEMLNISTGISGSPDALHYPVASVEWVPYTNA